MPESKSGSNLRQVNRWQRDAARAEYLRHPDASIAEVAKAANVAVRTAARARDSLVKEGLLAPGRNASASGADAAALAVAASAAASREGNADEDRVATEDEQPSQPRGAKAAHTIDGEALRQMNDLLDQLADEDDETTRKRMLRQVKKFAFDPNLHPDTRMSASQLWAKLLDMQRAKDLGPGIPQTLALAIERATDFCRAAGLKVMVPAFYAAFDLGDPNGKADAKTVEPGDAAPAPAQPAGPTDDDPQARGQA